MHKVINAKASDVFPLIQEIFENSTSSVCITVTGDSMYPFLRNGIDSVELAHTEFSELKKLDIVLIKRTTGDYVLHRLKEKDSNCFHMVGDAQQWIEGPLYPEQLCAVVKAVWRRQKRISCDSNLWRILSGIWMLCLPVRYFILKASRIPNKIKRMVRKT